MIAAATLLNLISIKPGQQLSSEHCDQQEYQRKTKDAVIARLNELLQIPGSELVHGAGGIAEGVPEHLAGATLPKFRPNGLRIVHCGGRAGLFSMMIGGWASGAIGSEPVMKEIRP